MCRSTNLIGYTKLVRDLHERVVRLHPSIPSWSRISLGQGHRLAEATVLLGWLYKISIYSQRPFSVFQSGSELLITFTNGKSIRRRIRHKFTINGPYD